MSKLRLTHGDRIFNTPEAIRKLFDGSQSAFFGEAIADMIDRERPENPESPYAKLLDIAFEALKLAAIFNAREARG